jgi:hypothetical protein
MMIMINFYSLLLEINLDTRHITDIFIFNYKKLNNSIMCYDNFLADTGSMIVNTVLLYI